MWFAKAQRDRSGKQDQPVAPNIVQARADHLQQRFGRFDAPRLYVPEIPSWLDDLVAQLLEKEPDKRPPDA